MSYSKIYLYGELNDFLSNDNPKDIIFYPVQRRASIKDVLESLGPPHTEIAHIYSNGAEIDFGYLLKSKEQIEAYPHTPPVEVFSPTLLRPEPLKQKKFIVDVNVGKLAKYLRTLGYDANYHFKYKDKQIAELAAKENRIVLTRDINLLKRNKIVWGRYIRAAKPLKQLKEVLFFYGLKPPYALFTRCLRCNSLLQSVNKDRILNRLEPKTKKYFNKFSICLRCSRIYWAGSHQEKMISWLKENNILTEEESKVSVHNIKYKNS